MSENILGQSDEKEKYQDLYASILRIAEKSQEKEIEKNHAFRNLSTDGSLTGLRQTYIDSKK